MKSEGWQYVEFLGFLSREEVMDVLQQSKIGMVTLPPLINYLDSLPIKMFEYMLAGIAVIASDFPYWKTIININKCGITVDPMNPKEIANKVLALIDETKNLEFLGNNGQKAVLEKYNWSIEEQKLLNVYKNVLQ